MDREGGNNIQTEKRSFGGSSERATQYAKEIVALNPDAIVANGTIGIEAVLGVTRSIQTVFVLVGNPVGSGFVASLAHPGGNVTGFSAFEPEIAGKWMQVLKEIAPAIRHVTVLFYPGYEFLWRGAEAASPRWASRWRAPAAVADAAEIEQAISAVATTSGGALVVLPTPLFGLNRELIIRLAASRIPGGLSISLLRDGGRSCGLRHRSGRSLPAGIAVCGSHSERRRIPAICLCRPPTKFQLVVNLKTAKALGLTVPRRESFLLRADEVIE